MKNIRITLLLFISVFSLFSCSSSKDESMLKSSDTEYIQELGILNKSESIEMFESNGGLKLECFKS